MSHADKINTILTDHAVKSDRVDHRTDKAIRYIAEQLDDQNEILEAILAVVEAGPPAEVIEVVPLEETIDPMVVIPSDVTEFPDNPDLTVEPTYPGDKGAN